MSTQEKSLINLKQLNKDYQDGYSNMGHPDRAYYILSNRGMESLQSYCSSEVVRSLDNQKPYPELSEVSVTNLDYEVRSISGSEYIDVLKNNVIELNPLVNIDNDVNVYKSVINEVYDGELERDAFISAFAYMDNNKGESYLRDSLKYDIVRAWDGDYDLEAQAAGLAYRSTLALNYGRMSENTHSSIESNPINKNEWLNLGVDKYLNHIVDDHSLSSSDTIDLNNGLNVLYSLTSEDKQRNLYSRTEDWDNIAGYLDEGIVLMLEDEPTVALGTGLKHHKALHEAFNLSYIDDLESSFNHTFDTNEMDEVFGEKKDPSNQSKPLDVVDDGPDF